MNKIPILSELALFASRLLQQRDKEEREREHEERKWERKKRREGRKEGREWRSSTENKARVKEVPSRGDR